MKKMTDLKNTLKHNVNLEYVIDKEKALLALLDNICHELRKINDTLQDLTHTIHMKII